jgi:hypothetical protein
MIYVVRREPDGAVNLYRYRDTEWKREPMPTMPLIDVEFTTFKNMHLLALAILLEWFAEEEMAERKAVALSAAFGVKLAKLATRRQVVYANGKRGWDIDSREIEEMVAQIMVSAGEMVAACTPTEQQVKVIEYVTGQRRDTVRQEALAETTSRRASN